MAKGT
jgi:nuclear GTP-binding protein